MLALAVLTVHELHKKFGALEVVRGVSFEVRTGECYGLLGPNGAGKSTMLKALLGFLVPTSGTLRFSGSMSPGTRWRFGRGLATCRRTTPTCPG